MKLFKMTKKIMIFFNKCLDPNSEKNCFHNHRRNGFFSVFHRVSTRPCRLTFHTKKEGVLDFFWTPSFVSDESFYRILTVLY